MAVLDQVMQLKNQGMDDNQIISTLQEQGISPNEINNALSQAQIKNAVTGGQEDTMPEQNFNQGPMTQEQGYDQNYDQEGYDQGYGGENQEYYPQEGYDQGYGGETGIDSSTIVEIAEQVFSEKIKKIENQIEELNEFKTLNQTRIDNIDERLKKIESMIDKLQITILEKVGSYGQNLGEIKKEMNMMQDSFGKMVNNIADKNSSPATPKKRISKKTTE